MANYYFTAESWGSDYAPENWEEICSAANERIDQYIAENSLDPELDADEIADWAGRLFEDWITNGNLPEDLQEEPRRDRIFGNENTDLCLTDKAQRAYSNTDPLTIIEHGDGTYSIRGIEDRDGMSADDVNEWLEDLAPITYKEALELNESRDGLDLTELPLENLLSLIDEVPGWDYPLGEDFVLELARRAGIDSEAFLAEGRDYNDLCVAACEALDEV